MSTEPMTPEKKSAIGRKIELRIRAKAKRRVRTKVGFMWHFAVFVLVMLAIVAINLNYTPDVLWFVWPLGAWGGAVLLHAFATFSTTGMTEDMVQAEIKREKQRRGIA
jgi:hypothetical protein